MSPTRRVTVRVASTGTLLASDVHVAGSLWARFRGLMGRAALGPDEGLWLPGDVSIHMLFMRFPIDAVFLAPGRVPRTDAEARGRVPPAEAEARGGAPGTAADARGRVPGTAADARGRVPATAADARAAASSGVAVHRVVAIRTLRPWIGVVWFVRGARGCLELPAGAAQAAGLRVGDEVAFEPVA